ncbi:peptidase [Plantactinospora sp. BC1]|uniref:peptidase n=1 Tax=Plantactinospora sp. BC1 TaxID=2108470 RepID=UPI00131EF590|nr:peptidase [Plantactinospora sp. BC1]
MTNAILRPGSRLGAAAAAVLATLALTAAPSPAHAAAQPQLQITSAVDATIDAAGTTIGFRLRNTGDAPATDVGAVYDAQPTTDDVIFVVPAGPEDCYQSRKAADCRHGELAAGQERVVQPFMLRSGPNARPGPAGVVRVSVTGQGPDGAVSATYELPVTIRATGSGLVAEVDDIGSEAQRVGGGDRRPLHTTVFNFGTRTLPGFALTITLPLGATFVERYGDCVYEDDLPGEPPTGYVYGPQRVTCQMHLILEPGSGVAFSDPVSGDAAFNVVFGKNLPGPAEQTGRFEVGELDQPLPEAQRRAEAPAGPSLADRVAELRTRAEQRAGSGQRDRITRTTPGRATTGSTAPSPAAAGAEPNVDQFSIWTKPNSQDLEVRATEVTGSVGDTVDVPYTITNHGPSDGGAAWRIVAPSGTVLLPSQWCTFRDEQGEQIAEATEVDCGTDSRWLATASGEGVVSSVVRVKITSTPGTNGKITIRGLGPSTETGPKSNSAQLVINQPGGGGGADDDDGLPITGVRTGPIAAVGAGALLLGAVLLLLGRRRRPAAPPSAE